jgi:hypothetical protein
LPLVGHLTVPSYSPRDLADFREVILYQSSIIPGIKEDSLPFASSLVRAFSSGVRGRLGDLSLPPGHKFSLSKFKTRNKYPSSV